MNELDGVLRDAVAREDVPFVVAMIGNQAGTGWSGSAGESLSLNGAFWPTILPLFQGGWEHRCR